ncbi:hypothetical protein DDB_G0289755 [Dictyostelium discoideum AX4]|uniref:Uncharacterized protein n=1 Tax=Dictyostelium discoideum TaxID=44689 RepID=Q54H18_DICDI|nr:hypothetical protein DDB_G0289755 [Dictyostelium discoideum AX4]EAL62589.1 hypothetical protein DDB_G0289755 [Dictyostelium discoideum AX4]|eukprot:XP_636100.1 hypothetical protein DDB_G0289755 [Dictyostelium discoideum AX4]
MVAKEDIAKFLLGKGYYLTALEFYQELLEDDGTELESLKQYLFGNKNDNNKNDNNNGNGSDFDPIKSIKEKNKKENNNNNNNNENESMKLKDDKISLLEYELRQCKDDLYRVKAQYNLVTTNGKSSSSSSSSTQPSSTTTSSSSSSMNGVALSISEDDKDTLKELSKERIKQHELRILNYLVKSYLKKNNYTLTAVSMSEEIEENCQHWSDVIGSKGTPEPPSILTMYRYFFENGDAGIQGALSRSMTEITKLKKDLYETESQWRESKKKLQQFQKEKDDLILKNKEFENKIEEFSRRGLLSPLRSSQTLQQQQQTDLISTSNNIASPPTHQNGKKLSPIITSSNSTINGNVVNNGIDITNLSVMRKTFRNLIEKRRQTVAFRIVSNMDDESEISVRIAEEVDKIRTLDSDNQSIVKIVADSLPNIVPGVLINKREELIPLILVVISNHPDETVRFSLTKLLFNLIKKPNEVQRHVIMRGCMALASFIGPQRTETEILSQCWEQLSEKYPERRVLVADSCGCLSQFASADLRLSLILSILQQLGEDKSSLVRESVAKNFALLVNFFDSPDKYNQIEESFKKLLYDTDVEVSIATRFHFLPSLANWADLLESLNSKLTNFLLTEMLSILIKYSAQKDEFKIPEQDTFKLDQLLQCFIDLIPRIHQSVISSSIFINEKDALQIENEYNKQEALYQFQINNQNQNNNNNSTTTTTTTTTSTNTNNSSSSSNSTTNNNNNNKDNKTIGSSTIINSAIRISILGNNEISKLQSQFENYLMTTVGNEVSSSGWPSLEWISNDFINKFIRIISCIPFYNSTVITGFSKALNLFCKTFGTVFTKRIIKNAFNKEFQKESNNNSNSSSSSNNNNTTSIKKNRLLSIYTTGALQTLESSEFITFLKDLIVQISMEERGWLHSDIPALVKCIELLCGNVFDKKKDVCDSLCDLTANPSNQVRSCILNLLNFIIPVFKPEQIGQSVVPSLITMSTDPDRTVRFVCLGTLSIAVSFINDDTVIEKVAGAIDRILEDKNHMVELEFVNSMSRIIPTVKPRFRDSFILPRIIDLTRKNNHNPSNQQRKEMSQCLYECIRSYVSITTVPRELISEQVLPMLKLLLNDALLHDPTFKSMVQSLVNDLESSIKEDFRNSIGAKKNTSTSSNKIDPPNKWGLSWKPNK